MALTEDQFHELRRNVSGGRQKGSGRALNGSGATIPRRHKYGAQSVEIDGRRFASKKEGRRYQELRLWERMGIIRGLECQPRYDLLAVNAEVIGHFTPDFRYHSVELGRLVVEDVKGGKATRTEAYALRKRLFEACYGIKLSEV